jgi:hypothetical protein
MAEEKNVIGAETKYPLDGILTIPNETNGLFPAVVLVHGSGPGNMVLRIRLPLFVTSLFSFDPRYKNAKSGIRMMEVLVSCLVIP